MVESRISGPVKGTDNPFSKGEADVGFMCAPSFLWLRELKTPPIELLPGAPVFRDSRTSGQPVYFSEVVVRRESTLRSFHELRGRSWAYNDPCSLSGYYSLLRKLAEMGEDTSFFDRVSCSGSHLNSMEMIARGEADAAAVDSNVLRIKLRSSPELKEQLQVLDVWGPFPIQPTVLRSGLHPELKDQLCTAILRIGADQLISPTFAEFGLERFALVTYEHYASEEQALRECKRPSCDEWIPSYNGPTIGRPTGHFIPMPPGVEPPYPGHECPPHCLEPPPGGPPVLGTEGQKIGIVGGLTPCRRSSE
jgi:phosphonate transport system substrate-binding protein